MSTEQTAQTKRGWHTIRRTETVQLFSEHGISTIQHAMDAFVKTDNAKPSTMEFWSGTVADEPLSKLEMAIVSGDLEQAQKLLINKWGFERIARERFTVATTTA